MEILNTSIDNEVFVARTENNSIYTTSLDIADKFNKRHDNVTKIIKNYLATIADTHSMFVEDQYEN